MTKRLHEEEGWALVTAFMLMIIMLGIGLAVFAMSDTQIKRSTEERGRESELNLTEGVLSSQIFNLSRNWPATVTGQYTDCTEASTNALQCPTAATVRGHFEAVDFKSGSAWRTQVRDNSNTSPLYYTDAAVLGQPAWDANQDGQVWVRAEGEIDGESRVIVAQVRVEKLPVSFPNAPFVAGSVKTGNSGNKIIINLNGGNGLVRCDTSAPPAHNGNSCKGYDSNQTSGGNVLDASESPNTPTNIVTPEILDALRQTARANGTYYTNTCPSDPSGKVVFVEGPANCAYNNSGVKNGVNSSANPGVFIVNNGTASCNGNIDWYGVIYLVNAQNSSGNVWDGSGGGGCTVYGAIFVDGPGSMVVGSNKFNLIWQPNLAINATAYGTAGIVQNTWREYIPSS